MRKLTQKLVLSVVTMALVVVALGTSTFAWFTLQNAASVKAFEAQVTSGEGIEVSLGTWTGSSATITSTSVWYTVLPNSAIVARLIEMYGGTGDPLVPNFKFTDLTSSTGAIILTKGNTTAPTSGYISLDIFFRSAVAKDIRVTKVSITGDDKSWVADVPSFIASNGKTYGTGAGHHHSMTVAAWTAARVSIVGINSFGTNGTTTVFEREAYLPVEENIETTTIYNSNVVHAYSATDPNGGANGGANYYYAKGNTGNIALPETMPTTVKVSAVGSFDTNDAATGGDSQVVVRTSTASIDDITQVYTYGGIKVRVWIEGFDADSFDAIFSTTLSIELAFDAVPV